MSRRDKVVWSEGMFLRTQHFQQQDRAFEALVTDIHKTATPQAWGFGTLFLDAGALRDGHVGIEQAECILPDGTYLSVPDDAQPLVSAQITSAHEAGLVRLGLPMLQLGTASIDPSHAPTGGARLRGRSIEVSDAVQGGEAGTEEIELARPAPRLLGPDEDGGGYVSLPIARVQGLDSGGRVILDPDFIPPALHIGAVTNYAGFAKEVIDGLDRIADAHGEVVLNGTGASVENLMILELANACRPRIAHMRAQKDTHPSAYFMELASLAGRMATFGASARRMAEMPEYEHANPSAAFAALMDQLRSLMLSLAHVERKSRALKVSRHSDNVWTVRLENPEIIAKNRIVIRVGGEMSEAMLRRLFVDQATVGAASDFEKLWTQRLPGIQLKPLLSQPREIPYDGERLCLELDRSSDHWTGLRDAPGFVVGVSGELDREPEIDCYAVSR